MNIGDFGSIFDIAHSHIRSLSSILYVTDVSLKNNLEEAFDTIF